MKYVLAIFISFLAGALLIRYIDFQQLKVITKDIKITEYKFIIKDGKFVDSITYQKPIYY